MKATVIENHFKGMLNDIAAMQISAKQIRENARLYNELSEEAYTYFAKVVLLSGKNRSNIKSTGIPFEEFVDDLLLYFLDHLDSILACDPEGRIPYIVWKANRMVIDKVRRWNRMYGTTRKAGCDGEDLRETAGVKSEEAAVGFLDELAWSFVADDTDIEQDWENREMARLVLKTLATKAKSFDAVAFMATNILGWKTGFLADKLLSVGYQPVVSEVLSDVIHLFGPDPDVFSGILEDSRNTSYTFQKDAGKLAANLSRRSYTAKDTVRKLLRGGM